MSFLSKLAPLSLGLALASLGCLAPPTDGADEPSGAAAEADAYDAPPVAVAPPAATPGIGYTVPGIGAVQAPGVPPVTPYFGGVPGELGLGYPSLPGQFGAGAYGAGAPGSFGLGYGSSIPGSFGMGQYEGLGNYWLGQNQQFPHWGPGSEMSPLFMGDWAGPGFPRFPQGSFAGSPWGTIPQQQVGFGPPNPWGH